MQRPKKLTFSSRFVLWWPAPRYGKEIDEHDFVVRFNVITKPYKQGVGSFASALFIKPNYHTGPFKRDLDPTRFNIHPK